MEYLPFGETLVEEHQNSYNTPYKFNDKELDDETGNYYYGARYYNPKFSIWLSVDPLTEQMPSWSSYNYAFSNPVIYTDPTGMSPEWIDNGDGTWTAEKGDSAGSLAKQLKISQKEAEKILANQGYGSYRKNNKIYTDINPGDLLNLIPDKTEEFNATLKETYGRFLLERYKFIKSYGNSKGTIEYEMAKLETFRVLVTDGAEFDIKGNPKSSFYYDDKSKKGLGNYYQGKAIYNGETFRYDDFGNYNYGVASKAFGIPQFTSELGAGINQLGKYFKGINVPIGDFSTFYDDFRDNDMVKRGYNHKIKK